MLAPGGADEALVSASGQLLGRVLSQRRQPIYEGSDLRPAGNSAADFGYSAQDGGTTRPPLYRAAWDDCGGVGASATERTRQLTAKIKGWAKPLPMGGERHAAQDAGSGEFKNTVFPGPEVWAAADEGLRVAAETLEKYPAAVTPKAEDVSYLYHEG